MQKKVVIIIFIMTVVVFTAGCTNEYQITLEAYPQEGGHVYGEGTYQNKTEVTVEAEPFEGYMFVGWEEAGEVVSTEKSYEFEVENDRNLVAVFGEEADGAVGVILYFGCPDAMESGGPGKYGFVTPVARDIPPTNEVLLAALDELIKGPSPEDGDVTPVVPSSVKVLDVKIEDGVAIINVSEEMFGDDWVGGTLGGTVFVQSITRTAAEFPEVDRVQVLVEGNYWDDGHSIWDKPKTP